ncbi:MAG TPA: hypothetical protein VNP72_03220 [Longimicrobium sp.]|nr:hypothetical protein [Longimicrobium sp.]
MRKLVLRVEELEVESFDTTAAEGGRGTVDAHQVVSVRICATEADLESCASGCTYEICSNPCADLC